MQTRQMLRSHITPQAITHSVLSRSTFQARRRVATSPTCSQWFIRQNSKPFLPRKPVKYSSSFAPVRSSLLGRSSRYVRSRTQRRANSTKDTSQPSKPSAPSPDPTPNLNSPDSSNLSLSQRMRKLSREYGWSALGVYMGLSALDFPFCFAAVRLLGVDRIGQYEQIFVSGLLNIISLPFPEGTFAHLNKEKSAPDASSDAIITAVPDEDDSGRGPVAQPGQPMEWSWGVREAARANREGATIWTQLALAYAIHKSFIFVRVPLTAVVTPKVVKVLRGWGWNIGKRKSKVQT